ncbi:MAG: extracellular solute-binding protein [Alphaproteobacteria bacterium]|nr:extracellular solute-binding protein [Alphaproteobacteria bacterium]
MSGAANAAGRLAVYNWPDYMPQELLDKFAAEHDVEVTLDSYESNEVLLARLQSGVTGYDVALPSDYMVRILIEEGLLQRVRPDQMSNFSNVSPQWADVYFDPGREYSVPYLRGTTSFSVDTAEYDGDIDTLAILFAPPPELRGRINMLEEVREVMNAGLRYLGYPRCNSDREQLRELNDLLVSAKEHWLSISADGPKEALVSGDAAVSQIWNGYAARARAERPTLKYAYPREGYTLWMDNLVVPVGAPNLENAKLFLNFMMAPENIAVAANFARYHSGLSGVEPYLDPELLSSHELNPPAEAADNGEFARPCSQEVTRLYDRIWTNLLQ